MSTLIRLTKRHFWCSYDVLMPCLQNRFFQIYYISCHMYNIYFSMPACQPIMFYYIIIFLFSVAIEVSSQCCHSYCSSAVVHVVSTPTLAASTHLTLLVFLSSAKVIDSLMPFPGGFFFRLGKLVGNGKGWNEIT